MIESDHIAENLGRCLDRDLGSGPGGEYFPKYYRCIDQSMQFRDSERTWRRKSLYLGIFAAIVALIIIGLLVIPQDGRIEYKIDYPRKTYNSSNWVKNEDVDMLPIVFENGSRFELSPRSSARMLESNQDEVRVNLHRGTLEASVIGNGHTKWIVEAGPYTIRVLGTVFTVIWNAEENQLEVKVTAGEVTVKGHNLGEGGIKLLKGQYLKTSGGKPLIVDRISKETLNKALYHSGNNSEKPLSAPLLKSQGKLQQITSPAKWSKLEPNRKEMSYRPTTPHPPVVDKVVGPELDRRKSLTTVYPDDRIDIPAWDAPLKRGEWALALSLMKDNDWRKVVNQTDVNGLWQLANLARHEKQTYLAIKFFKTIRRRSPGTERSAMSAYLLGKSALDLQEDPATARKWLNIYLEESPTGALTEEALTALVLACTVMNDPRETKAAALRYLKSYPNGIFAARANSIVNGMR